MRSLKVILLALLCIQVSHAQSYECANEKDGDLEYCVFHNVRFFKNTTNIEFNFPGATKPVNVAFKDSHLVGIPGKFVEVFGDGLKVLKVDDCQLQSVTITRNIEALYARNNFIEKVLMDRSGECASLIQLDLSSNRLKTVNNITNCVNLKELNLSGNEKVWPKNTVDFSHFRHLNRLEDLDLSDTGIFYMDNLQKAKLESLKLLDLSKNDILPSDLRLEIFEPFSALETLKLNDNNMEQLDYADLTRLKSLKSVFLNGNNFPCRKVKDMIDFLNKNHNIDTPLDRHSNCGDRQFDGMCCKGPMPTPAPAPVPRPTTPDSPPDDSTSHETDEKPITTLPPTADGDSGWQIILAASVLIVIIAGGAGYLIYRKRSRLRVPEAEGQLNL